MCVCDSEVARFYGFCSAKRISKSVENGLCFFRHDFLLHILSCDIFTDPEKLALVVETSLISNFLFSITFST